MVAPLYLWIVRLCVAFVDQGNGFTSDIPFSKKVVGQEFQHQSCFLEYSFRVYVEGYVVVWWTDTALSETCFREGLEDVRHWDHIAAEAEAVIFSHACASKVIPLKSSASAWS